MKIQSTTSYLAALVLFFPFAADAFDLKSADFKGIICYLITILNLVIPILVAVALVYFFWGLSKFVLRAGNEKELAVGKNYMFWGILALFVLFSFRAIVGILTNEFEFGNATVVPLLPGSTSTCAQSPQTTQVDSNFRTNDPLLPGSPVLN